MTPPPQIGCDLPIVFTLGLDRQVSAQYAGRRNHRTYCGILGGALHAVGEVLEAVFR